MAFAWNLRSTSVGVPVPLLDSLQIQEEMAGTPGIKYVELEDGTVGVELQYNDEPVVLSMEQCVAMMLTKLVKITLVATGAKPGDCVISIPG
jgi:molecular chaperone DnaK (HSP70)